jgi:hypothetical protein
MNLSVGRNPDRESLNQAISASLGSITTVKSGVAALHVQPGPRNSREQTEFYGRQAGGSFSGLVYWSGSATMTGL